MSRPAIQYAQSLGEASRLAASQVARSDGESRSRWLGAIARRLRQEQAAILCANRQDLAAAEAAGLNAAMVDRLTLTADRLQALADAVEKIRLLDDPVGEVIAGYVRPNGLRVSRVRVPLGVVFFIYESRPNVTVDAAALCVKSGNAVILRGGKEAARSNAALSRLLIDALPEAGLPSNAVQLVETPDREVVGELLKLQGQIDVVIPRGGRGLIERVSREATMPVIRHFDGVCHVYVDRAADLEQAKRIVVNSKCQRPGVCNAAESLLVHADVAAEFLPACAEVLIARGVELRGCQKTCAIVPGCRPAAAADFGREYLDLILSVRVVDDLEEAIGHIDRHGSGHTEAIVSQDVRACREFSSRVDAAAVMVNASTRFNDGGELGLGAEIGISTDKFHARGPCGLRELTSYKYVVEGDGHVR